MAKKTFTKAEIKNLSQKRDELESRNPSIAINALVGFSEKIGGVNTLPLTLSHYVILEKLDSPFLKQGVDFKNIGNEKLMEFCFLVTRPAKESRELLIESKEVFDDAVFEFCENVKLSELRQVGEAIARRLFESTSTALEIASGEKKTQAQGLVG